MFGWFRKRPRHDSIVADRAAIAPSPVDAAVPAHDAAAGVQRPASPVVTRGPASAHSAVPAPSLRPAMPLGDHPNFAGLGLAQPDLTPPRLLEPEAALSDEARHELTGLLLDMFGPRGRYRLEWRADRQPGDDAMFSQIMVADLVRRIQNTIAIAADLEVRAAPLRLAIEEAGAHPALHRDPEAEAEAEDAPEAPAASDDEQGGTPEAATPDAGDPEATRAAAIDEFLSPPETLEQLTAATHPDPAQPDTALPHHDTHEVEGDRRVA